MEQLNYIEINGTTYSLKGDKGEDGYTPIKGVDYFTKEDKQEMVDDVLASLPTAEEVSI